MVPFEIGPVSMRAARRWLRHARGTVNALRDATHAGIPAPVLDEFELLIDQWSGSVDGGERFHWQSLVPVERVRRLSSFWATAARAVRSPDTGLTGPPREAQAFYDALVSGAANALAAADEGGIGPTLRSVMPRFGDRERSATRPVSTGARRLLIVEDTQDVRLLLRLGLRGYSQVEIVGEAVDGFDALTLAVEVEPDVVLLDVALPRLSGLDALPHLRALLPDARIVMFSASNDRATPARAAGADDFVMKGVSLDELVAALVGPEMVSP
jgi:CheY-like chemotaxis protein